MLTRAQLPVTGVVQMNTWNSTGAGGIDADVSCSNTGSFAACWWNPDPGTPWNHNNFMVHKVRERNYNSSNVSSTANELYVYNGFLDYDGDVNSKVAMKSNGEYIVVYEENYGSFDYNSAGNTIHHQIYFQKYNANGTTNGSRSAVDIGFSPNIEFASDGTFNISYIKMVNWNDLAYVRRYSANGTPLVVAPSFPVTSFPYCTEIRSRPSNAFYCSTRGSLRRFNSFGTQIFGTINFIAAQGGGTDQFVVKPNGDFVILSINNNGTNIQRYLANGNTPYSNVVLCASNYLTTNIHIPSIGINDQGDYVIVFPKFDSNGNFLGMYVQQYCVDDTKVGPEYSITSGTSIPSDMNYVSIDVSDCEFVVNWRYTPSPGVNQVLYRKFKLYPKIAAGPSNYYVCPGQSVVMTNTAMCGVNNYTYNWSPTTGLSSATVLNPTASPNATTNYTLNVLTPCGTHTFPVTVTVRPSPIANAGPDHTICAGSCATIGVVTGQIRTSYNWTPPTSLSCITCQTTTACPASTTVYTLTATDFFGCTAQDQVTVTVVSDHVSPYFTVYCYNQNNQNLLVHAIVPGSIPNTSSFSWTVSAIDPVTSNPLSNGTLIDGYTWSSVPSGSPLYFPGFDGDLISHDQSGITPSPGDFKFGAAYKITRGVVSTCTSYTTMSVQFSCPANKMQIGDNNIIIDSPSLNDGVQRSWTSYPNPTNGIIKIAIPEEYINSHIDIYNAVGELVHSSVLSTTNYQVNMSEFSDGIYFIKVGSVVKKVIKQ